MVVVVPDLGVVGPAVLLDGPVLVVCETVLVGIGPTIFVVWPAVVVSCKSNPPGAFSPWIGTSPGTIAPSPFRPADV